MSNYLPPLMVVLGVVIAIGIPRLMRKRRGQGSSSQPKGTLREQWEANNQAANTQNSADRILVELVETSREISARMDTKIRILNTLIRNAERCIERMEELQDGATTASPEALAKETAASSSRLKAALPQQDALTLSPRPSTTPIKPEQPLSSRPIQPVPVNASSHDNELDDVMGMSARLVERTPPFHAPRPEAVAQPAPIVAQPEAPSQNDTQRRIGDLHRQGYSVPEIARDVAISRTEVNLVLHLQNQA